MNLSRRIPLAPPCPRSPAQRVERARQVRAWLSWPALPARVEDWPEEWRDRHEERAAIMEFLGELPREDAERRAESCVRAAFEREGPWLGSTDPERGEPKAAVRERPGGAGQQRPGADPPGGKP